MCVTYLLEICKRNDQLIYQLKENITTYEAIINFIGQNTEYQYKNIDLVNFYTNLSEKAQQEVREMEGLNNNIKTEIQLHCDHEFFTDHVDLDYDRSVTVCYCTICELNKN